MHRPIIFSYIVICICLQLVVYRPIYVPANKSFWPFVNYSDVSGPTGNLSIIKLQ